MKKIVFFSIFLIVVSCERKENVFPKFDDFIFINFNLRENSSLKFSGTDTLYLQRRFPEDPMGNYYTILDIKEKNELIQIINNLNLQQFKREYIKSQIEDGKSQVYITKNKDVVSFVHTHGGSGPQKLNLFGDKLYGFIKDKKFVETKENIQFWNIKNIIPPPPPPIINDTIIFKK